MEKEKDPVAVLFNDGTVYCRAAMCPVERWYDENCVGCPVDMLFDVAMQHGIDVHIALNKKRKEQENGKAESN